MIPQSHRSLVSARRSLAVALSVLVTGIVLSSVVFSLIEGWDFFQALFFVIITVTTVGYGDEGISVGGRWLSIVVMLGGIGGTTYCFALMVQVVLLHGSNWRWRMQRRIDRLTGHSVVVGYGNMGRTLAAELQEVGREVVVLERDARKQEEARERGLFVVDGDATSEANLQQAGVARCREVATCLDDLGKNLVVVLSARDLSRTAFIVGRIEEPADERRMRLAGADEVISPLHAGALDAARLLIRPSVTELQSNHLQVGMDLGMGECKLEADSPLIGLRLREIYVQAPEVTFVALVRHGVPPDLRPAPEKTLEAGDVLVVVGPSDQVQRLADQGRGRSDEAAA